MDTTEFKSILMQIAGTDYVSDRAEDLQVHASDETEDLVFEPQWVVWPANAAQVAQILKACDNHRIPVTPRGAGTGLSGGALPVCGGVSLDMSRMNKILHIDLENHQVMVEPGVINDVLREAVAAHGLYYPPDPASKGSCFIGGNVAHNSGGPKAVKYGVTRDYILNMEVALTNGELIWTGSDTLKNATGYSLTHLLIGSEGTLGVVTKIVLKLIALPAHAMLLFCSFDNARDACSAVPEIMKSGVVPSAMEFVERSGIDQGMQYTGTHLDIHGDATAFLIIELDGFDMDKIREDAEKIYLILEDHGVLDVTVADNAEAMERIWKVRRAVGEAVKAGSVYKEEDAVVKRAYLPELYEGVKEIGSRYGFESVCYGHAGDGNLHINILRSSMKDAEWNGTHLENGIREIFRLCKKLGGTISGEHGIGWVQKKYMGEVMAEAQIELMRGIKKVFDPNNILNPGKIFERSPGSLQT